MLTPRGPVVIEDAAGVSFSLRRPSELLGDLGFGCLLPLLRARTAADVVAALEGWVEPVNNLLVADTAGAIQQQVVGLVPRRVEENRCVPVPGWSPDHAWTGWWTSPAAWSGPPTTWSPPTTGCPGSTRWASTSLRRAAPTASTRCCRGVRT